MCDVIDVMCDVIDVMCNVIDVMCDVINVICDDINVMCDVINASDLLQFTGLFLHMQETKRDKTTTKNAVKTLDYVLVGFSTTRYESFPAGLHGIRTDKTQTHLQRETEVAENSKALSGRSNAL